MRRSAGMAGLAPALVVTAVQIAKDMIPRLASHARPLEATSGS